MKTLVWGSTPDGQQVKLFTLSDSVLRVQLTEYGARIVSIVLRSGPTLHSTTVFVFGVAATTR